MWSSLMIGLPRSLFWTIIPFQLMCGRSCLANQGISMYSMMMMMITPYPHRATSMLSTAKTLSVKLLTKSLPPPPCPSLLHLLHPCCLPHLLTMTYQFSHQPLQWLPLRFLSSLHLRVLQQRYMMNFLLPLIAGPIQSIFLLQKQAQLRLFLRLAHF